jgi:4-amino-4-deoxy-L-arabinose transferase-like glycosyltransferase
MAERMDQAVLAQREDVVSADPGDQVEDRFHVAFLWTVASLMIGALWIKPLVSSFWTDEFGTYWVINGSASQVLGRAQAVQGQSPLYYLIAWVTSRVAGHSEIALRAPSLVFLLLSAVFVYRITRRLFDRETARIALITFAVWPSIAFSASDARPYAVATFCTVVSTWALIRWLDDSRVLAGVVYVILAASVAYAHPLFGLVVPAQVWYAATRIREGSTRLQPRDIIIAFIAIAVLIVPVALEVLELWRRHNDWSVANTATVPWIVQVLIPPAFIAAGLGAVVLARPIRTGAGVRRMSWPTRILILGWFLIPAIALVSLSIFTPVDLLPARYFQCLAPAGAILSAVVIRTLEPDQVRRLVILLLAIMSVLDLASPYKSGDMRGAAALVGTVADQDSVVLVRSGFAESMQLDWYGDPNRSGLFTAATEYYPVPGKVVPLPVELDSTTIDFARSQVEASLPGADRVVELTPSDSPYIPWLDELMRQQGWTSHEVGEVNLFRVMEFTKDGADPDEA